MSDQSSIMNLHPTEIRIGNGDFAAQMTRMRVWLDSRRFEPAVFRYSGTLLR